MEDRPVTGNIKIKEYVIETKHQSICDYLPDLKPENLGTILENKGLAIAYADAGVIEYPDVLRTWVDAFGAWEHTSDNVQ